MLKYLVVQSGKPILQEVATADIKRGTPIENGEFLVNANKNYDGINAVVDPLEKDCDVVAAGATYNKVPTRVGERYADSELTVGTLTDGKYIKVTDGKFVAAVANDVANWKFGGTYSNPYGVTMYIVEKIPAHTVVAGEV